MLRTGALSEGGGMVEENVQAVHAEAVIGTGGAELQSAISRLLDLSLQDIPFEEMLDEVIGLITSIASLTLESKAGIWLVEEGSPDILVLKAERGFLPEQLSVCGRVPFGVCVCGRAAASKTVKHVSAVNSIHAITYEGMPPHGHYSVPIVFRGRALGVMTLYIKEGRERNTAEECFLSSVAAVLAWAIEKRRVERELREITYYDSLTGLPNRRLLVDRLGQILLRGKWKKRYAAVVSVDVDKLKAVNDLLGREAGDKALKAIAARLSSSLREGDSVCREAGDEFVMVLQDLKQAEDISHVLNKIYSSLKEPLVIDGQDVYITASSGVSVYPYDGEHPELLLKNASTAMYEAKRSGRGQWRIYSPSMEAKAIAAIELEAGLRKAIERDEFILHYQPQLDLKTERITAFEALVRWNKAGAMLVQPMDFIPAAESSGLIVEIGGMVLQKACVQAKALAGLGFNDLRMAVNISARQFRHKDFFKTVAGALKDSGLPPANLELELTESVIMEDTEEIIGVMFALKALGVRFSIDDFGTGYSSLSYLRRLPIDTLKIDRSFVRNMSASSDDASIVIAIVRLAHSLRLDVVAEGVETENDLALLKRLECDRAQGYLISRPVEAAGAEEFLRKSKSAG